MSELLYRCPETQKDVSLGITLDPDAFEQASFDYREIGCPHCGKTHKWEKSEVYFKKPPEIDRKIREKQRNERVKP